MASIHPWRIRNWKYRRQHSGSEAVWIRCVACAARASIHRLIFQRLPRRRRSVANQWTGVASDAVVPNRNWGHPVLVTYLERLARDARAIGWPGLLIGDLSQPRGGPMLTGHASHQIGLDADIWLTPMPNRTLSSQEREDISAISMLSDPLNVDRTRWTATHTQLIKLASSYPEVDRIFVHPAIKQVLCDQGGND